MATNSPAGAQIITLEIQFGSVEFNENFEDFDPTGVLSIRAKVLNFPTIEINENDFCNDCSAQDEAFSKGKHLIIPVPEEKVESLQKNFVINIKVLKTSLPENLLPLLESVGFTTVNIARTFTNLLSKIDPATDRECPAVKLMSDQLEIIEADTGAVIGTLNIYIRLKAFGKCIVTAMQDVLRNKTQLFDKCFDSKDVVCTEEDDDICPPGIENISTAKLNEFKELKAVAPDLGLTVRVSKPVETDPNLPRTPSKPAKPGVIKMGKDILFNELQENLSSDPVKYEMKTGRARPGEQSDYLFVPADTEGPLTGQPVDNTADVYTLSVTKRNAKKNVYASVQMEVRVPKTVKPVKERFTRDVQYTLTDLEPPAAAGKKK